MDINARDKNGQTPLQYAVIGNHPAVVKVLLSTPGINIELKNENGRTAMDLAIEYDCLEIVEMLVMHNVPALFRDPSLTNRCGKTAVQRASGLDHNKLQLKHGADPKIQDEDEK